MNSKSNLTYVFYHLAYASLYFSSARRHVPHFIRPGPPPKINFSDMGSHLPHSRSGYNNDNAKLMKFHQKLLIT